MIKFDTCLDISPWRGSIARNRRKSLWGLTVNTSPFSSTPFSPIVSAPFGSSNPFNRSKIAGLQRFTWSSSNHVPFLRHWNAKMRLHLRFVHKFSWELDSFFFFFAIFETRRFSYYWDSPIILLDRSMIIWDLIIYYSVEIFLNAIFVLFIRSLQELELDISIIVENIFIFFFRWNFKECFDRSKDVYCTLNKKKFFKMDDWFFLFSYNMLDSIFSFFILF